MGHYKHDHGVRRAGVLGVLAVVMLLVADGVSGIADLAGLLVLMMIVSVLGLFATPISNAVFRMQETDADSFSLVTAHEPDGLAKALVKKAE